MFKKEKKFTFADDIYNKTVQLTREPFFFKTLKLKKEFQSRFELIVIFLSLTLWILRDTDQDTSQDLVNIFFQDLDACLRELGAADLSVGKKMKILVEKFYGRLESYTKSFDFYIKEKNVELLHDSINRNIYKYSDEKNKKLFIAQLSKCVINNLIYLKKNKKNIFDRKFFELKK